MARRRGVAQGHLGGVVPGTPFAAGSLVSSPTGMMHLPGFDGGGSLSFQMLTNADSLYAAAHCALLLNLKLSHGDYYRKRPALAPGMLVSVWLPAGCPRCLRGLEGGRGRCCRARPLLKAALLPGQSPQCPLPRCPSIRGASFNTCSKARSKPHFCTTWDQRCWPLLKRMHCYRSLHCIPKCTQTYSWARTRLTDCQ